MFDLGRSRLKPYTKASLEEVAHYLESVPNRISITGHTDTTSLATRSSPNYWASRPRNLRPMCTPICLSVPSRNSLLFA